MQRQFRLVNYSLHSVLGTLFISLLGISTVVAQTTNPIIAEPSRWGLGAGIELAKKPYKEIETDIHPLPLLRYENKWISFSFPGLDLKLLSNKSVVLSLRAKYIMEGYDADDSYFLENMDERRSSVWGGGGLLWKADIANFSAEILGDLSGNSQGLRAKLQSDRRFVSDVFGFTPRLSVELVDSNYVNYYYGVKESEIRVGREAYDGSSSSNFDAGMRMDWSHNCHTLFLDSNISWLGSTIKDSPLVGNSSQTVMNFGYIYRF